jgi:RecA-family ATPase
MLSAYRGVGKTWASCGIGLALASGTPFLGWVVPEPAKVLYVDGEMSATQMKERLDAMVSGLETEEARGLADENFHLLSHEVHDRENGIPNLASDAGRQLVEAQAEGCALVILDNLSCLYAPEHGENDAESWAEMQSWILKLRRAGKCVLIVHHNGKPDANGHSSQRGTSKREDILNTSVVLARRPGMARDRFTWDFTKHRGFTPDNCFQVEIVDGACLMRVGTDAVEAAKDAEILRMINEGRSIKDIKAQCEVGQDRIKRVRAERAAALKEAA